MFAVMTFDKGQFDANLAAAVGDDPELLAELRAAFLASARRCHDLMGRSRCDANWQYAAWRLKSVAASFGEQKVLELAEAAAMGAPGDPVVLREIGEALAD
jgi:hypothetical protein